MKKPTITLEILPFDTPSIVYIVADRGSDKDSEGRIMSQFTSKNAFPLSACDAEALNMLCDAYRSEVFKTAGILDTFR